MITFLVDDSKTHIEDKEEAEIDLLDANKFVAKEGIPCEQHLFNAGLRSGRRYF